MSVILIRRGHRSNKVSELHLYTEIMDTFIEKNVSLILFYVYGLQ